MQLNIKHSDENLQTQINRYDFATDYKKNTYCMKWYKKKSSVIAESEWEECNFFSLQVLHAYAVYDYETQCYLSK